MDTVSGILVFASNILAASKRTATPLLLTALGLVFSERAGIVNIGIEGFIILGAVFGSVGSALFMSAFAGTLFAITMGVVCGLLFGMFTIKLRSNQIVVGTAINILAGGLTISLNRKILIGTTTEAYAKIAIPLLSRIPIIGSTLFNWQLLVYLTYLLVPISSFMLYKTNVGLKIRAVGEHPRGCDSVGINVYRVRYGVLVLSGVFAALAGSYISMGQSSVFVENMVAGKGFMALAVCVFGNYTPGRVMFAALLFGAADALKYRLLTSSIGVYYQFLNMLPYVITIISLCIVSKTSNKPAASGIPYIKD